MLKACASIQHVELQSEWSASYTADSDRVVRQFQLEADKAQLFDRPITAQLLDAVSTAITRAPLIHARLLTWPGDLSSDAVAFRLNGALQSLYNSRKADCLEMIYGKRAGATDVDRIALVESLANILRSEADYINAWLDHPTQTNEVGRCVGLAAVLSSLSFSGGGSAGMPFEVLEIGSSAGLNLNFSRYGIKMGEEEILHPASALILSPKWIGKPVPAVPIEVMRAIGVDIHPLDASKPSHRDKLQAYIWPDDDLRRERLRRALKIASAAPPIVEQGCASRWINEQLIAPQQCGTCRVVFHSMALQYIGADQRHSIERALNDAGRCAEASRPLVRIGIEWDRPRSVVEVTSTIWDAGPRSGESRVVAHCHPYGEWFHWFGLRDD
ncbi:DUF2332 family protein [Erythrobacter sp. SCSIO 43205]|uniref:DUF2332 family protein n=1 Tax=Erythrobacter sp. SCSIO 43205 TaxID=2779361 RepID=UPI001CAA0C36|nr:DUF2332 family protein [Erythrobacter sp. SCSIO 43205]UAB79298.1 DUF2332 family protein [Erythrobacter sp. SCSIO 43205]